MTLNEATAMKVRQLLHDRNMTQYRLEQNAGISHSTMKSFLSGKYKSCNLTTIVLIIRAFGITISEFFSDPIFESDELDID